MDSILSIKLQKYSIHKNTCKILFFGLLDKTGSDGREGRAGSVKDPEPGLKFGGTVQRSRGSNHFFFTMTFYN